ncbi:MAG: TIGR03560 family F420-dependent LLM class oxidoreductase [Chloroflexota bacterium]
MAARFGVQLPQIHIAWPEYLALWQELDESPVESAWTMDHLVPGRTEAEAHGGPCLEGWIALAALAQATRHLRLGCLVTGVTYRHPAVLAKMATTVDIISNGRLEFGIGAAWHEYEHQAYGIPFYTMKERQDRLEEAIQLIKALWTGAPATFRGKYYQLDGAPFLPPNVQKPHPPIMVGGSGPKRTLRTAARYADAVNLWGSPDMVRESLEVLKGHCRDVGRDSAQIRVTVFVPIMAEMENTKAIIGRLLESGFDDFIVSPFGRPDGELIRRFVRKVIPAFR